MCIRDSIKSFPLHSSQQILKETPEITIFEFLLYPTYDFMQEILSYGKEVTVLEPKKFAEEIKSQLENSLSNYKIV